VTLPGGDFAVADKDRVIADLKTDYPFLSDYWAKRLIQAYGTEARELLQDAQSADDLGADFGATLTEAEVAYLMAHEYAHTAEDVVWRRSKLGLRLTADQVAAIDAYMTQARGATT